MKRPIIVNEFGTALFDIKKPVAEVYTDFAAYDEELGLLLQAENFVIEVELEDFDYDDPDWINLTVNSVYILFEEKQDVLFSDQSFVVARVSQNGNLLQDVAQAIAEYWWEHIGEWSAEKQAEQDDYYYEQAKDRRMEEALKEMER